MLYVAYTDYDLSTNLLFTIYIPTYSTYDVSNVWILLRQKSYETINTALQSISLYKICYKFQKPLLIIERNKLLDFAINHMRQ